MDRLKKTECEHGDIDCFEIQDKALFRIFGGTGGKSYRPLVSQHLRECAECRVSWQNFHGMTSELPGDIVSDATLFEETRDQVDALLREAYQKHLAFEEAVMGIGRRVENSGSRWESSLVGAAALKKIFDQALEIYTSKKIAEIVGLDDYEDLLIHMGKGKPKEKSS